MIDNMLDVTAFLLAFTIVLTAASFITGDR